MYYKRPYNDQFELVAVSRVYVLEKNCAGDLEVRFVLADGETLERIYTLAEYSALLDDPPRVIV